MRVLLHLGQQTGMPAGPDPREGVEDPLHYTFLVLSPAKAHLRQAASLFDVPRYYPIDQSLLPVFARVQPTGWPLRVLSGALALSSSPCSEVGGHPVPCTTSWSC